eukprot:Phypoly_transcript_04217.p1 GENE.Phypoly_transcript_04217~~Phypoly_transcript_04217.p1  ORF type:complete len:455 (-),score=61.96 Phypoly_transcript_04217:139-1503(-)
MHSDAGLPSEDTLDVVDFADLEIEKEIGKGSFGVVHKATYFGAEVAVKQFKNPENGDNNNEFDKYLRREIFVHKNMRHPNIVQFVGYAKHQGTTWLVTEYVPGGNLHVLLKDPENDVPWNVRLKLARDIAYAMAFLHSKKILYRDLKAKNAVVETTADGYKGLLCDFGFARSVKEINRKEKALTICGTDNFMAPEVILGIPYDEKADVYSFGVLLLEFITRKKIRTVLQRRPQDGFDFDKNDVVKHFPGDCLVQFAQLFFSCCEYRPQLRPSFKDILVTLSSIINSYDGQQTITETPVALREATMNRNGFHAPTLTHSSSQNKFVELQHVLGVQIDSILQYVNVLSNETNKIKTEQDVLKVKHQCKAVVDIKEHLNALASGTTGIDFPPHPTFSTTNPGLSRVSLLKQNMLISLLEISTNLKYLKELVKDGREYSNMVTIGKTIREIKRMLVSI